MKTVLYPQGRINAPRGPRHIFSAGALAPLVSQIKSLSDAMKTVLYFELR